MVKDRGQIVGCESGRAKLVVDTDVHPGMTRECGLGSATGPTDARIGRIRRKQREWRRTLKAKKMRHGSNLDPPNRFETVNRELDLEHLEWDEEYRAERENRRIEYIFDASKSVISENNSPDIPFKYSLNPYRGCVHA
jgi:hypothetical protein